MKEDNGSHPGRARGWPYVVTGVLFAGICAWISYNDGLFVARLAGNHDALAFFYPLLPDGLIVLCLLALAEAARAQSAGENVTRSRWAVAGLLLGIALTLAMNTYAGVEHSVLDAVLDGMVPVVFFIAAEVVLWHVRHGRVPAKENRDFFSHPGTVPSTVLDAARASMKATVAAGNPLSMNQLVERFGLTRSVATKVRKDALREEDGNGEGRQDGDPDRQRQGRQARQDSGRGQQPEEQVAHDRGRGNSNLTTGAGAAPATQRSRDGADHPVPRDAVPAVKAPAGPQHAPVPGPAGAQLQPVPQGPNGSAPRG